ncbi:hypothetical protein I6J77_13340 [Rhodanobacter sp. FDAARGOS 1247]|uniref:hypothetical protein n=1 Tax=Rhodanobacter sp. FDAARGOS 1247 TaxID=2778082 RepID=UPI00194E3332|nr:hypothetical protein [Rhodanobacter sp. FDAARGOS 1247]QRP63095.1 hypothetical protein I6J77_13340 [Rhodanobacter sp. FDAARGOS 1247]
MKDLIAKEIHNVSGGLQMVSSETIGCAIGGAMLSELGPWGAAAGCIVGGDAANSISGGYANGNIGYMDFGIGVTPLG